MVWISTRWRTVSRIEREKKKRDGQSHRRREKETERGDARMLLRASACMEACVSDLSRPSHISRSVAFAPSHFRSRPVNDPVGRGRCSRCSKVVHQDARTLAFAVLFCTRYRPFQRTLAPTAAEFRPRNRENSQHRSLVAVRFCTSVKVIFSASQSLFRKSEKRLWGKVVEGFCKCHLALGLNYNSRDYII